MRNQKHMEERSYSNKEKKNKKNKVIYGFGANTKSSKIKLPVSRAKSISYKQLAKLG